MAYKRLSIEQWIALEREIVEGASNLELAKKYGISEGAIRKRRLANQAIGIPDSVDKVVKARTMRKEADDIEHNALINFAPAQVKTIYSQADTVMEMARNLSLSAELGSKTSHRLASIANFHASKLDDEAPDTESLKMIHALTETANKAAMQPIEVMKAMKGSVPIEAPTRRIDPSKMSDAVLKELQLAMRGD